MNKYLDKYKYLFKDHKKVIVTCIILICIQGAIGIGATLFSAYYGIDIALASRDLYKIIIFAIISFVFSMTTGILFHVMYQIGLKESVKIGVNLKNKIFNKAIYLDMKYHSKHSSGAILNIIDYDTDMVTSHMTWTIPMMLRSVLRVVFSMVLVTIINPRLSLILWVALPIVTLLSLFVSKKRSKLHEKSRRVNREAISHINERIMGFKTVKSLNLEEESKKELGVLTHKRFKYRMQGNIFVQSFWRMFDIAFYLCLAMMFIMSYDFGVSYGEIYLYYNLFQLCLNSITQVTNSIETFAEEIVSIDKIHDILEYKDDIYNRYDSCYPNNKLGGFIEFKDVSFYYNEGEVVLDRFTLNIEEKEKVAIVGKTGSGKSTIANLLFRFYEPRSGYISIDKLDYTKYHLEYLHNEIGFILQDPLLFDDTIINNVKYGKLDATLEEVERALELANCSSFIKKLPNGKDTLLTEGATNISLGQRQLITIARAVLANPKILILDEATSSVDTRTEKNIQDAMVRLMSQRTSIIIAHRLSTIKDADLIVVLDKGVVKEIGNHEQLIELGGSYYNLYQTQFKGMDT
jgi:ATP-binding cassette subfamily B protein